MKVVVEPEARAEIILIRQMIALGGVWAAVRWSRKISARPWELRLGQLAAMSNDL